VQILENLATNLDSKKWDQVDPLEGVSDLSHHISQMKPVELGSGAEFQEEVLTLWPEGSAPDLYLFIHFALTEVAKHPVPASKSVKEFKEPMVAAYSVMTGQEEEKAAPVKSRFILIRHMLLPLILREMDAMRKETGKGIVPKDVEARAPNLEGILGHCGLRKRIALRAISASTQRKAKEEEPNQGFFGKLEVTLLKRTLQALTGIGRKYAVRAFALSWANTRGTFEALEMVARVAVIRCYGGKKPRAVPIPRTTTLAARLPLVAVLLGPDELNASFREPPALEYVEGLEPKEKSDVAQLEKIGEERTAGEPLGDEDEREVQLEEVREGYILAPEDTSEEEEADAPTETRVDLANILFNSGPAETTSGEAEDASPGEDEGGVRGRRRLSGWRRGRRGHHTS
jgi:hypothetical protein